MQIGCVFMQFFIRIYICAYYKISMIILKKGGKVMNENLKTYKKNAIIVAEDCRYGSNCINAIKNAETESEITRILISYRKKGG